MATPKDLLDYAGERLYRNSLDDILDQIQQDIDNERIVTQARQSAIVNDPDPVKKLREVQSIEKSVVNEPPEVQATVLNQTYNIPKPPAPSGFIQPDPNPQFTMGQPRGELQNLTEDDIRFRVELERIQEPFDRIFQEKLKTAKEIPGRNVTDPISGASYTVPGSTKEQVAKQKTIEQLEKDGVIKSQGFRNFLTTAIPLGGLSPEEQAQQTFFPARTALAQLGGAFAGLGLTSQAIRAPKIAQASYDAVRRGTKIGNFLTQKGINTVKAGKFTASATTGAGTFGAYRAIDQIDEDAPVEDKAKAIVEDAIFGAGFGLTGSFNNPATRSLAEGTFGFVTSKLLEGATTQEALLNGLLFAGFGVLNKRNMSDVEKGIAINEFKKVGDDSFRIIQDLRKQVGQKPFTKLQEKQWKKSLDQFAERFRYEKYNANDIKRDTEEFITRFLRTNDPKGSIAKIRQLGKESKTQVIQKKTETKPVKKIKKNIAPVEPVPGPAPDVTPSTKKSDKLVPEKLEPKPKEVKPEVQPTKGEATGLKTTSLKPSDIKIDESKFQPREEYNQAVIDDIAKNFDPKKWDEPVLWQDPKTNEYIVVSGHHRHRGVVKGGYESATYKVLPKGTTIDEAINMSEEGNLARTEQSAFENSKVVRRRFDKGDSLVKIAEDLPGLTNAKSSTGKSNAVRKLLNISFLNNKGKFKSNYDNVNEFPKIQSTSSYVGALRRQYDWMPDRYEDDVFTYLYTENGIRQDNEDWKLNLESTLEKLADVKDRPGSILKQLRKEPLKPKEGTSNEVLESINKQKNYIETLTRQIEDPIELDKRVKKKQKLAYGKKYLRPDVVARRYDEKWKADSTWYNNLWRLTPEERNYTSIGEDVITGKSGSLSDLDQRHIDSVIKADKRGEAIRPEVIEMLSQFEGIKESNIKPDDRAIYENNTVAYQEVVAELKKERADAKKLLKQMVEDANAENKSQTVMFDDIEQYNIFGGTDILKEVSKKDKEVLDQLHEELSNINKEQFFLTNQVSQNKINKLKARQQQKALDKRYKDTIKKMQKIDKPVNGATNKPGFVVDINEQIKLNLQNKKQTELFRETASKEDKENTKKLTSEVSRLRSRLGITTRATNILEPLEKVGASHFIGQKVRSPEELAVLAQVARDRRFETFYILYTNRQADGTDKIVQYTAVSNRMPGWVNPFRVKELGVYRSDHMTAYMYTVMRDSGADGYYLLHNHPSSTPYPSKGDIKSTELFMDNLPGFRAHVVINTKDFGYILPKKRGLRYGMQRLSPFDQIKKDPLYDKKFDKLNINLDGDPGRIPDVLKNFADNKNVVSVFATNYSFQLNALVDIPIEKFLKVGRQRNFKFGMARLKAQIRKIARDYGGQRIFLVTNRTDGYPGGDYGALERVFRRLYKDNFITEGFLFADYAKPELGHNRVSNRTATWQGKLQFGKDTRKNTRVVAEANYRGSHTAPSSDYGAPGHDLTEMYPDDIYGPNGARYYGHGGSSRERRQDEITIRKILGMQGNPDKMVKIYRAVPKGVNEINPGDWVTINRDYAKEHGERHLDKYKILIRKVPAREIYTDGNSIHEWGWNPESPLFEDDIPAVKIKPHKQLQKEAPKVPKKIYDVARNEVEGKSRFQSIINLSKTIKKEFKEPGTLNRVLTPLSTRLRVIAPELKRAIRRFEYNVSINTAKDLQVAENFMKQTDKLRKKNVGDYTVLDLAMKNSDLKTAQEILDKHDMGSEFVKVRNMLDNIYVRAEMVGYEPNYLSDYFPRKIKDGNGLMNYLYESDSWGILSTNIKQKEKELGRRLEKDERLKLINNLIRGFGGRLGIQRPANLKEREIEYLNADLNKFYYDSNTALHRYIVQMNEAIEIKRFFGKGMGPQDPNIQVDNNVVGEYVDNLLDQGVIKPNQQDELINLLRIRFAQGPMDPRVAKMRSGSYLLTMGQLSSAVTQIGDLAWSIYSGGLTETGVALGKSVVRKSAISKKDIGIEKIAQEFTEVPGASKILDRVFTLSGLNYVDSLGKESLINSTISRYQKQARKGKFSSSLQERLEEAFSKKELPKVIDDLKSGNITDDIKYLAHYTLSDFQPVSLSEMPEYYLKAPNGRIMYMLKSYQIKQFNVIRDEAFKKMNQGKTAKEKAEGVRRLIYLASVLMLTGMTADKIKNFMYGREQELDEMVTDNLLRLFGFNKYLVYVQKRYKNWAYTALKFLAPPVFLLNPVFESFMQDLDKFYRRKKKGEKYKIPEDVKTVKNLPLIGKFYYEYFGPGKEYNMKRKEKKKGNKKRKKRNKRPPI